MERNAFTVSLPENPVIAMKVIPGHFTTSNAHLNHYLDVSGMKSNVQLARSAAQELAAPYLSSGVRIDTIVCMEKTEVIGAYLAEELLDDGSSVESDDKEIHVITPLHNANGNLVFQDSAIQWIAGRNIILLVATISSGRTVNSTLNCLRYYGGCLAGISALFLADPIHIDSNTYALFTANDISNYQVYSADTCDLCRDGVHLDALVSSEGYTKI